MYNFILEIALMVSLGVMVYLIARAVPRVEDETAEPRGRSRLDDLLSSVPLSRLDAALGNFLEKVLRKTRLVLMRLDNVVGGHLNRVKKFNKVGERLGEEKQTIFTTKENGHHRDSLDNDN